MKKYLGYYLIAFNYAREESRAIIHESGAAHRVSAVETFVAGAVADGD